MRKLMLKAGIATLVAINLGLLSANAPTAAATDSVLEDKSCQGQIIAPEVVEYFCEPWFQSHCTSHSDC